MVREERVEPRAFAGASNLTILENGERQYRTTDKTGWGDGPWQDEPDKLQWIDAATGLDCLAVRNHGGAWCGYVGIPETHPWFGIGYNEPLPGTPQHERDSTYDQTPEYLLEVHGGVTYTDRCQEDDDETQAICHIADPGRPEPVWWFGFDCVHAGDFAPKMHADLCNYTGHVHGSYFKDYQIGVPRGGDVYRDVAYVREQAAGLAAQLAAVASAGAEGR